MERLEQMHPTLDFLPKDWELYDCYREAPLEEYYSHDPYCVNVVGLAEDLYPRMGEVHFLSLVNGRLEHGLSCQECGFANVKWRARTLEPEVEWRLVPQGYHPSKYLHQVEQQCC